MTLPATVQLALNDLGTAASAAGVCIVLVVIEQESGADGKPVSRCELKSNGAPIIDAYRIAADALEQGIERLSARMN